MSENPERDKRDADHLWHTWMNRRQRELASTDPAAKFEHSLYKFKEILQFLEYGHEIIREAFEGRLATVHRQCSHQPAVQITGNSLKCACMGQDVTTCPILLGIKEVFEEANREPRGSFPPCDLPVEMMYRTMAKTCAWHSYKISCHIEDGRLSGCDLSEGILLDESDRMFWRNVYDSLADDDVASDPMEGY